MSKSILLELGSKIAILGHDTGHKLPKCSGMIEVHQMTEFMDNDIISDRNRK